MIETLALLLGGAALGGGLAGVLLVRYHRQQRRDLLLALPVPVAVRDVHGELQWNAAADALLEGTRPADLHAGMESRLSGGRRLTWAGMAPESVGFSEVFVGTVVRDAPAPQRRQPVSIGEGGTILVVDDDPLIRSFLRRGLSRRGFVPLLADSGAQAMTLLSEHPEVSAVLLDINLDDMPGAAVLEAIRQRRMSVPVFAMTGMDPSVLEGMRGLSGFLQKPFQLSDVMARLKAG